MAKDGCAGVKTPTVTKQGSDTMKPWLLVALSLALPAIAGCRVDPAIPLLERELYRKEKEINRLQWQIEDLQELLNSGEDRPAARDSGSEDREPDARSRRDRRGSNGNGVKPPVAELPGKPSSEVPDALKAPAGSLPAGIPEVPEHLRGPSNKTSDDGPALDGESERFSSRPGPISMVAGPTASAIPFNPSGDSSKVASIALDRMLTGGIGCEDRSGDKGLLVVIEPRDRAGRTVDAPGDINVAVLDPAFQGDAARVARWNFTAAETASLFRRTGAGGAIHLAMAWPENPPKHNKLHLFVRYLTADGRKLEANQPIEIALPGDKTARWTPSETRRPAEQSPAPDSWRQNETPTARSPGSPPRTATRTSAANPERPVWTPERR